MRQKWQPRLDSNGTVTVWREREREPNEVMLLRNIQKTYRMLPWKRITSWIAIIRTRADLTFASGDESEFFASVTQKANHKSGKRGRESPSQKNRKCWVIKPSCFILRCSLFLMSGNSWPGARVSQTSRGKKILTEPGTGSSTQG